MNSMSDFYDKLDLKYPEIAIAMEDIDRSNPGKIKFIIPVLTPNLDSTRLMSNTIYQTKANLRNNSSFKLEVENITLTNYIEIPVPSEVCMTLVCGTIGMPDDIRYIKKGSKWIVVFVGGDITKPRIISRYLDD